MSKFWEIFEKEKEPVAETLSIEYMLELLVVHKNRHPTKDIRITPFAFRCQ
jgi:hypothetical protein